jgi:copper chaperone CopZ
MQDIVITISGMSCAHCMNAVRNALGQVAGVEVKSVRIGGAELRVPDGAATAVETALSAAGYHLDTVLERKDRKAP